MENVQVDFLEIHEESVRLLNDMGENDISPVVGAAGMMLSLGRMVSPEVMSPEDQVRFLEDLNNYLVAYFIPTNGVAN
jgi:hypothetical protein